MLEKDYIINGSKMIATYMGLIYIPSNNLGDFKKAGWFAPAPKDLLIVSPKQGYPYKTKDGNYKFICRNHNELRYFNSFDALIPVIEKIEKENNKIHFELLCGGAMIMGLLDLDSFDKNLTWVQNIFISTVKVLEYLQSRTT